MKRFSLLYLIIIIIACKQDDPLVTEIPNPANKNSEAANLLHTEDGKLILSYVEMNKDSVDVLYVSEYNGVKFSNPIKVSQSKNWFVNWADFPVMSKFNHKNKYAISWLQKSSTGVYDYDIHIAISQDGLTDWDTKFILHKDSVAAEHGFLSLAPLGNNIAASWLDGRNTKLPDGSYGSMTLRHALFNENGNVIASTELDDRVCDCCQIDMAIDGQDRYIVYRDRSMLEYRDNILKVYQNDHWSENIALDDQHWKIAGCPVNGPAIAIGDKTLASLSYTQVRDKANVWLRIKSKSTLQDIKHIKINRNQTLGRMDILHLSDDKYALSWIEQSDNAYMIHIATYDPAHHHCNILTKIPIHESRKSGFPRIAKFDHGIAVSFVDVQKDFQVKTVSVPTS